MEGMNGFTAWVNDTIRSRGWSISELARRSGFSQSLASDVLNEKADASANFVIATANALGEDPVSLLRLAGHLPDAPPVTSVSQAVCEAFRRLDARHQSAVSDIVFALAGMPGAENAPAVSVPSRSGQTLEKEAAYPPDLPVSAEQPTRQSMVVDDPDQEVYQAFRRVLDLVWETAPREERGRYFLETAIEVMHQREHEPESK